MSKNDLKGDIVLKFSNPKMFYFSSKSNSLFFIYNSNHPIRMNIKFVLGYAKIFSLGKLYAAEFTSDHLMQKKQLTQFFFKNLLDQFHNFQIVQSDDEYDSSLTFEVKQNDLLLFRCKLVEQFGLDIFGQFWKCCRSYTGQKQKSIKIIEQEKIKLAEENLNRTNNILKMQRNHEDEVNKLEIKLSAIFNEKKKKLLNLGEQFDYEFQKSSDKKQISYGTFGTMQGTMMMGSLFQPSQDFR